MSDQVTVLPPWTAGVSTTPAVLIGVDPVLLRQWLCGGADRLPADDGQQQSADRDVWPG